MRRVIPCNLRAIRKLRGYTAADFADACNVTPSFVSHLETGKRRPALATALKMAQVLHVQVHQIWLLEDLAE